jgi:eukaryotic-like serine/threonine-protein kinase
VARREDDDVTVGPTTAPLTPIRSGPQRFAPGSIVAGRYRLVALLGKGGMGEVYRADDLTLDQPVALKFLPPGIADADRLARFHSELRIARQVSHKNVCRLYDLGESDGRRFLTMEYVDGEDLAVLLRRIGRFPEDRAVAIARQLCAGVAAAHERGVIHRDLKPANVMIDGDGNVRITDFGIATATAGADVDGGGFAGTPQYMAPEQLNGQGASIKTDIYALGLVLFEIFTGKRARDAATIQELRALDDTGTVTTPSALVRDLDPAVERVILRCLDRDPAKRPASALVVAAALPGGDPLAAALAAGETPSPDILVAAAESEAVPILQGLALAAGLIASIVVYALFSARATMADLVPLEKPPAVLADRAQQILADFGYTDTPADTAQDFIIPPDFPRWLVDTDPTVNRWKPSHVAAGPALLFWHRTSPRDLEPDSPSPDVTPGDPAMTVTGQSMLITDTKGRLVEFRRVPPQRDAPQAASPAPQWSAAFRAAGLNEASFKPVDPEWTPKDFADVRAAWDGPSPDTAALTLRVEAAAYRGRIISLYVLGPWARPRAQQPIATSTTDTLLRILSLTLWFSVLAASLLLARHNLRSNRADRRGASRVAFLCLAVLVAAWAIGGHHRSSAVEELNSFFRVFGNLLFQAALLWILYVAIEPYGRRFWPDGLLGWTRLFSGRVRDPRIGREILIGSALGGVLILNDLLRALAPYAIGRPPGIPALGDGVHALSGPGALALIWSGQLMGSVQTALLITMMFVGLRLLVRRTWLAVAIGLPILTSGILNSVRPGDVLWLFTLFQVIAVGVITFAIFRFGLLVTTVMLLVDNIPTATPFVTHGPSWAAFPGNLSAAVVIAIACFGFYAARAGQPLFGNLE